MFGTTFGHGTLKKYVIFFGTLFNNIWINRYDGNGDVIQNFKVPLNYGPREKFLARVQGNPDLDRPIAMQLPRMSFEMVNFQYDPTRKLSTINRVSIQDPNDPGGKIYQYSPTPFNITFQLSIMVKNAEDGTYIVEQILPYFTPEWTASLNINPELGLKYDVPLILDSVNNEDTYEGDFINRRALIWTLTFTMKAFLFGPTKGGDGSAGSRAISSVDVNIRVPPSNITVKEASPYNTDPTVSIHVSPGQSANGEALNWYGDPNANTRPVSVDPATIVQTSEWGFMVDFQENI